MKRPHAIILVTLSVVLNLFALSPVLCFAADYYLHTTTSDILDDTAPTATTAKFKDSLAVNRTTYQQIGIWSAAPLSSAMQLNSLSDLRVWIGLKNSDDQGTYFDLKAELRKNGTAIAPGETKNIQGVTRNPDLAKEVAVAFGVISNNQFAAGDVLSVRILTKVADSGGHNNAVGLRLYYDAVSRQSKFGATLASVAPTKLVITTVNGATNPIAGTPFSVTVQSQDASGTPANVSGATAVSLSLKTGSGTLGGTLTNTIAAGTNQVTITGVTYTKAESGVVITATRTSGDNLTAGDNAPFTVVPGAATKVAFSTQPGNSTAGSPLSGPPTVVVQDSLGNTVTSSTATIAIAIGTNPGGGTLSGTTPKNASGGVASFSDLSINKAGNGYTLTASATGLTDATSSAFNISAGAASQVAFTTQPGSATAGSAIGGPPTATVQDSFGNTVTSSTAAITVAIGNNPGGGTLSGTTTKNAAAGVASFADLSIDKAGISYTLTASVTGLTSATSTSVNITAATATALMFATQPANSTAGVALGGPPTLTVLDSFGNTVTSSTTSITVAIGTNSGGSTLSGTTTKNASSGVVTFNDLSLNKSGTGYTLAASATGLTGATSSAFDISAGPAATLVFTTQPGNVAVETNISGPPTATVQDGLGNTVTSSTASIAVAIGTNPSGGTLSGTTTKNAVSGVASFNDLSINLAGNGYTLAVSSAGLAGTTSNSFNILSAGTTVDLVVHDLSDPPPSAVIGSSISVTDTTGNIGTATAPASTTRYYLSADTVITSADYLLTGARAVPSLAASASSAGTVNVTIPSNMAAGTYFLGACADDLNAVVESNETNNCRSAANAVTLFPPPSITSTTPTIGSVGRNVVIEGLNFGVTQGSSKITFNGVVATPTFWQDALIFAGVPAGATTGPIVVTVEGIASNGAPFTVNPPGILLAAYGFEEGSGSTTADASVNANNGTVVGATWTSQGKFGNALSFNGISNQVTAGNVTLTKEFTLMAWVFNPTNASGRETIISIGTRRILALLNGRLEFFSESSIASYGTIPNNTWTHVAVTYDGTFLRVFINGVAQFRIINGVPVDSQQVIFGPLTDVLQIGASGNSFFLGGTIDEVRVYSRGLTQAELQADMNTPTSLANKLVVTSVNGGSNPVAGVPFPVGIQVQNASGTPANVATSTSVVLTRKSGEGTLAGTLTGTMPAGANQVTIAGVTYTTAESAVVISATRTSGDSLTSADSTPFAVNSGAATALGFAPQPGNTTTGSVIPGPPTVLVRDSLGNIVTSSVPLITIAIGNNAGGGVLSGTTAKNAAMGVARFDNLTINQPGNGYTLTASADGIAGATSSAFNITARVGTFSGLVTRVSNGTPVAGALVEVFQGLVLVGAASTTGSGAYSITGLADGVYTIRASFTGFVPQIRSGVSVTGSATVTINLGLNQGIAIHFPVASATIADNSVLVSGQFDPSIAPEVGINVNGYVALQDGNEFAAWVPVDAQTTSLSATVTSTSGAALASHIIPITVQPPSTEPVLNFRPSPAVAFVAQPVEFTLTSLKSISQVQLDGNGDGTIDYSGSSLDGVAITFAEPGIYYPTVTVTDADGIARSATSVIQVLDMNHLDVLLTTKWSGMKNALRSGNTAAAANYIVKSKRAAYQNVFNNLSVPFANIDQVLTNIIYSAQNGLNIEYDMFRVEGANTLTYTVVFVLDEDGVWRIKFF